jgi:ABC-type transporter Mla subunit MlaD
MTETDAAPRLLAFPDSADRRLRRALRGLDAALEEQRAAIGAFRAEMGRLQGALDGLGASAAALRGNLGEAAADAARANQAAQELAATAEAMERLASR